MQRRPAMLEIRRRNIGPAKQLNRSPTAQDRSIFRSPVRLQRDDGELQVRVIQAKYAPLLTLRPA
jgi:hypothetical protein